ncbi:MAG: hypothetical protein NXH71_11050 [Erythrobacteraceae bacterium]|nr:hypothetical protein [Erythrobacteraceae bacterium]
MYRRCGNDHRKAGQAHQCARPRKPDRIAAAAEDLRCDREAHHQAASRQNRGQPRCHAHPEAERLTLDDEVVPALAERPGHGRRIGWRRARIECLLLPCGDKVQEHGDHGATLDHLDQPPGGEIGEKDAEHQRGDNRSQQQADIHQPDNIGLLVLARQPSAERCVSERNPISARNGATNSGRASITPTIVDATSSSTIITRLSVPTRRVSDIPTENWMSESLSRRDSGRSSLAASANGSSRLPQPIQSDISFLSN